MSTYSHRQDPNEPKDRILVWIVFFGLLIWLLIAGLKDSKGEVIERRARNTIPSHFHDRSV